MSHRAARHVLVVDDDRDFCRSLELLLRGYGLRVSCAPSALTGLARLGATPPPDLVLADAGLPGVEGFGAADGPPCALMAAQPQGPGVLPKPAGARDVRAFLEHLRALLDGAPGGARAAA